MKIDRQIVDDFLGGSTDLDSWIFSEIEPGKRLFCLSDVQTKQSQVRQLAEQITRMAQEFIPCNEAYYTRLFPDYQKELRDYPVLLTVGIPAPYDAMVCEHDGREWVVFDMGRFLSYQNPQEFARQMLTHETAHALLHQRWRPNPDASYRERLRFICFDEGFAHLLACGKELASFDPSGWIEEHQAHALEQLRLALACKDGSEQEQWLYRAQTGRYWEKFAAIAGKLYLLQHLDVLDELYQAGPQRFMPHLFDTSERN